MDGGREGPRSEEEEWSSSSSSWGVSGGEEGISARDDGGSEGPRIRRRLWLLSELTGDGVRDCGDGEGCEGRVSSNRLRLAMRWGGSSGPAVDIVGGRFGIGLGGRWELVKKFQVGVDFRVGNLVMWRLLKIPMNASQQIAFLILDEQAFSLLKHESSPCYCNELP